MKIADAECKCKHLRTKRRSAHAHQHDVLESRRLYTFTKLAVRIEVLQLFPDDLQPAEPFVLVAAGPDGRILIPDTLDAFFFNGFLDLSSVCLLELLGKRVGHQV